MPFEECCSRLLRAGPWYGMKSAEPDIIQDVSQHGEFNRRFAPSYGTERYRVGLNDTIQEV